MMDEREIRVTGASCMLSLTVHKPSGHGKIESSVPYNSGSESGVLQGSPAKEVDIASLSF